MKWRIMTVDDEEDVRLIIKTTLEPKYEIVEAQDGLDALEKLERYDPDFIIMDVMMPLMNGFEACASIRKNPRFREIPVLFLSALGSKEDMKKGYSAGANLYLTKPFDPPRLLKNIDIFFERTPPEPRRKRYTLEQIREAEKGEAEPLSPGSGEYQVSGAETEEKKKPASSPPQEKPAAAPEAKKKASAPGKARIMVVDDDEEVCELIRMTLMDVCEVVFASDGMQAIERLVQYQPDMLIIDIMLPKMNGYQLLQSLRGNRAFKRMPIMMCSAKGADRDINMAKRIGADDYLVKPFSGTQLLSKVEALQKLPGFKVRPKSFSINQIVEIEKPEEEKDVFADEESRRTRQTERTSKALGKFLAKEGEKEAFDQPKEEEQKKKRRLFGFGGRE